MLDSIHKRVDALKAEGVRLTSSLSDGWLVPGTQLREWQRWFTSAANVISVIALPGSVHRAQMDSILMHPDMQKGMPANLGRKMLGVLESLAVDLEAGLLKNFEYIVLGASFDNFLDHATEFHRANKKLEAAVLAGVVLEDTMRKIAEKHGIEARGPSLESLTDELVKRHVLSPVKAKRIKAYAGTRNRALHADWEGFDIRDVGEMISGVRELIEYAL
jgi:hypothetical protein